MATYRIRTQFDATGERSYLIVAGSADEAYQRFKIVEDLLTPDTEEYSIEREGTDRDEVDIDLVEGE